MHLDAHGSCVIAGFFCIGIFKFYLLSGTSQSSSLTAFKHLQNVTKSRISTSWS